MPRNTTRPRTNDRTRKQGVNTKMESNRTNKNEQPERKLSFKERLALKITLKKLRKQRKKAEKSLALSQKERNDEKEKMQECIKETLPIFNIEHNGAELTKDNVQFLNYEESLEIFLDCLKELEKIV